MQAEGRRAIRCRELPVRGSGSARSRSPARSTRPRRARASRIVGDRHGRRKPNTTSGSIRGCTNGASASVARFATRMVDGVRPHVRPHRQVDAVARPDRAVREADLAADGSPAGRDAPCLDLAQHRVARRDVEGRVARRDRRERRHAVVRGDQPVRDARRCRSAPPSTQRSPAPAAATTRRSRARSRRPCRSRRREARRILRRYPSAVTADHAAIAPPTPQTKMPRMLPSDAALRGGHERRFGKRRRDWYFDFRAAIQPARRPGASGLGTDDRLGRRSTSPALARSTAMPFSMISNPRSKVESKCGPLEERRRGSRGAGIRGR